MPVLTGMCVIVKLRKIICWYVKWFFYTNLFQIHNYTFFLSKFTLILQILGDNNDYF